MKNNLINESEINEILSMHKALKEQTEQKLTTDTSSDLVKLNKAITAGCLKNGKILTNSEQTKYVYRATTKSGKIVDFTADMNYKFGDGTKEGKWACPQLQPTKEEPKKEGPKPLDSNQIKILDLIKPSGWFHEPAPTDVEVDQNIYQKLDLSGAKNVEGISDELGLVDKYKKYFIVTDFPNGFFIYKKTSPQTPTVQRKTGLTVTAESCKIAIETLWNSVKNPNSYLLNDQEVSDYKKTAEICAQPENSEKFLLRFKLKDKLKDLVNSKYRINSRL
jgi:hypothetical protein